MTFTRNTAIFEYKSNDGKWVIRKYGEAYEVYEVIVKAFSNNTLKYAGHRYTLKEAKALVEELNK